MKGLCPWLVLIGLTSLNLVEDWSAAAVILELNPSPTGSFIIAFKEERFQPACFVIQLPSEAPGSKELSSHHSPAGGMVQTALSTRDVGLAFWKMDENLLNKIVSFLVIHGFPKILSQSVKLPTFLIQARWKLQVFTSFLIRALRQWKVLFHVVMADYWVTAKQTQEHVHQSHFYHVAHVKSKY